MKICIYGAASPIISDEYKKSAFKLGKMLAEKGHTLVFGGGKNGIMGECARAFTSVGGEIIGIVPKFFRETYAETLYDKCSKVVWCDTMYERKQIMEELAEGFVIAPGGVGTYDEFFSVLTTKQLDRHRKPIAVFSPFGFYDGFTQVFDRAVREMFVPEGCMELFKRFEDAAALVEYIESDQAANYKPVNLKRG